MIATASGRIYQCGDTASPFIYALGLMVLPAELMAAKADVLALEAGECWVLERKDFDALRREDSPAVIGLLQPITADLGRKLTQTSIQLTQLEHS